MDLIEVHQNTRLAPNMINIDSKHNRFVPPEHVPSDDADLHVSDGADDIESDVIVLVARCSIPCSDVHDVGTNLNETVANMMAKPVTYIRISDGCDLSGL